LYQMMGHGPEVPPVLPLGLELLQLGSHLRELAYGDLAKLSNAFALVSAAELPPNLAQLENVGDKGYGLLL